MPDEPISVEGNLATVDLEKRFFTLENREGVIFIRIDWDPLPYFDQKMRKQKIGYYEKPVVVMTGENTARLKELEYTARPASFPKRQQQKGTGSRQYQQRNEKLIVVQVLVKAYTDLYIASNPPDGLDFESGLDVILTAVEEDVDRLMKAGGA